MRSALALVCCATRAQTFVFAAAFDTFFDEPSGVPQSTYAPRHTRAGSDRPPAGRPAPRSAIKNESPKEESEGADSGARRFARVGESAGDGWQALRARYSPVAGRAAPLEFVSAAYERMRPAAARLAAQVWLGRSRRYNVAGGPGRFDLRRTLRASLKTGGDPVRLRFLVRPRRRPRFVMLVDGSRSMSEHTAAVVAFAAALCERNARTNVFFFSTALREVTEILRAAVREGTPFADLGEAWGGGTKIGANLGRFLHERGALLSHATLVFVYSDGLDVGDVAQLTGAMREIEARSAGIVWLNPHAAEVGYAPTTRGMRAALPFVSLLCAANDVGGFERLAARIVARSRARAWHIPESI